MLTTKAPDHLLDGEQLFEKYCKRIRVMTLHAFRLVKKPMFYQSIEKAALLSCAHKICAIKQMKPTLCNTL